MSGRKCLALFMVMLTLLSVACTTGQEPTAIPILQSDVSRETVPDVAPSAVEELVAGNNGFAFDLFHAVAQEDGNLFFSPYSISMTLAMTYAGARGETAAQMADTLHYTMPQAQLHPAANVLDLRLTGLTVVKLLPGARSTRILRPSFQFWRKDRRNCVVPQCICVR